MNLIFRLLLSVVSCSDGAQEDWVFVRVRTLEQPVRLVLTHPIKKYSLYRRLRSGMAGSLIPRALLLRDHYPGCALAIIGRECGLLERALAGLIRSRGHSDS